MNRLGFFRQFFGTLFLTSSLSYLGLGTAAFAGPSLPQLQVPAGLQISVYADGVVGARSMTKTSTDLVFVSSRDKGFIYALYPQPDLSQAALQVVSSSYPGANGIAWWQGDLYIADTNNIYVARQALQQIQKLSGNSLKSIELQFERLPILFPSHPADKRYPTGTVHGWKYIRFDSQGRLYVSVGAPCNACGVRDPYATIVRFDPKNLGENDLFNWDFVEIVASGVRNSLGFDWAPWDEALWFTDNGRDLLGDDVPPDELNRNGVDELQVGSFGFPWCFGNDGHDPVFGQGVNCADFSFFRKPEALLGPHVAALGMRFYRGNNFPSVFQDSIIIAEHGSWNRSSPSGYRVTAVTGVKSGKPIYQPLVEGWLSASGQVLGRPVDVENLSDGSLLISDELGKIWRLSTDH